MSCNGVQWYSCVGHTTGITSATYSSVAVDMGDLPDGYLLDNVLVRLSGCGNVTNLVDFRITEDAAGLYAVTGNVSAPSVVFGVGSTTDGTVLFSSPLVLSARRLYAWLLLNAGATASAGYVTANWRPLPGLAV